MVTLTVRAPLNWCAYSDGASAATSSTKMLVVPKGTVVHLEGMPSNAVFVWGYWTISNGMTSTKDTNASTSVKVDSDETATACCPLATDPTTPCPF